MMVSIKNIGIGIALVIIVGSLVFWQKQKNYQASTSNEYHQIPSTEAPDGTPSIGGTSAGSESINPNAPSGNYTMAQVAEHGTRESCWSAINDNVYDLTSWIPKHPGGEKAILGICGIDGSEKFNRKHGGAPKQAMILAGFKIGALSH